MSNEQFSALVLEERDGKVVAAIQQLTEAQLPAGDVTVQVRASTLNYKDGMVLNGIGRLVRTYPHVPGVDFAGVVVSSQNPDFQAGDEVVLTGWRVGEMHWGGYSQKARVKGDWLVKRPAGLSLSQTMAIGTAGFTAMLAVQALESHGLSPDKGEVLVTGAAGGVGSIAVAILSKLGYQVAASTGRVAEHDYLHGLGATVIIDRAELSSPPKRPLAAERWAGVIDAVGGSTLASVLTAVKYGGSVASCGLAGGNEMTTTVLPFLLRGVNLLGIDSVMCPKAARVAAWERLARDLPQDKLDALTSHASLKDVPALAEKILHGQVRGRLVIDIEEI
ncbi:MDR family oxidoreductase [Telmatospirillum sp.]|uniref:acrylyl-CoA reductase (NADPH) n=1 Tax=Telmatospirillum sp. TaxID=2079197 RepID=UPI00284E547B|nr:MDR family oxidoreductase [Telmatospirillum sp.]MDR3439057.1 oxidoreductase [Telmatospirillum sp.]